MMFALGARQNVRRPALTRKAQAKSDLLVALHDTAESFERLAFIDHQQMIKFDALCLEQAAEA